MDRTWECYAKWNKSERQILYDFTYMWNLKKKTNENTKLRYKEQVGSCQREGLLGGVGKSGWRGSRDTNFELENKCHGN